jgi:hypothetical protein
VEWHNNSEPAGEMLRRVLADNFTAVTVSFGVVFSKDLHDRLAVPSLLTCQ